MEEVNLNVLRMIQISKDMRVKDMAEAFGVTASAISAVKIGKRNFKLATLRYGLNNLGISLVSYAELEEFKTFLEQEPLSKTTKYSCMLAKTLGVVYPEKKDVAEAIVEKCLNKAQEPKR